MKDNPQFVLNASGSTKKFQHRVALKPGFENNSRMAVTNLPKSLEAVFILFADSRSTGGAALTREELDLNPSTRGLDDTEKDALVKWWPQFDENRVHAKEIRDERERQTALVLKASKNAVALKRTTGMELMPVADQLKAASMVFAKVILEDTVKLLAIDGDEQLVDPVLNEMYKIRVGRVKDFMQIHSGLSKFVQRVEEYRSDQMESAELDSETKTLLQNANNALLRRGKKPIDGFDVVDE